MQTDSEVPTYLLCQLGQSFFECITNRFGGLGQSSHNDIRGALERSVTIPAVGRAMCVEGDTQSA